MKFPLPAHADRRVLVVWLLLSLAVVALALPTVRETGLDYDEAVYGHLAKDFLTNRHCEQHMPGSQSLEIAGRPFPIFVQGYLGAVKCWLLLPSFAIFGTSIAVMRWTMLVWALIGVLALMLWTGRTLGVWPAVTTGFLLVLDPAFFFPTICEWGAFVPSFFCRCAGLLCLLLWWRQRRLIWMVLAGATFGIGFLNKIDFLVVLLALASAAVVTKPRELLARLRAQWPHWLAGVGAFVLTSFPMLLNLVKWAREVLAVQTGVRTGEFATKLKVAKAVLDGSYFHRLMESGGVFARMFEQTTAGWPIFGVVLVAAVGVLVLYAVRDERAKARSWSMFLLSGFGVATCGWLLLPDAVRVHHALLVYPFPQLLLAAAAARLFRTGLGKVIGAFALTAVFSTQVVNIWRTQQFIASTGGRGAWSSALADFAGEVRDRDDVLLVSFDWGFHEQLSFLTDAPRRFEPTWNLQEGKPVELLPDPRCFYLIHPPEFGVFDYGAKYLEKARAENPQLEVQSRTNREGRVVFQVFRFVK